MKKKIISNTIVFILIIAFISAFKAIFGDINSLVGVGVMTIGLVLVERDLTIHPFLNTIKLLAITLSLGTFAYLSHLNMWLAIPLNFIALFFIGYAFSYNLRKSVVLPFGLTYLFMLYTPIEGTEVMSRVLALVVGVFIIMLLQLLFNRKKFSKTSIAGTEDIYKNVIIKIEDMKINMSTKEIDEKIKTNIKSVKKVILDKRAKDFYLTKSGEALTDVIWTIERMTILLDELKGDFEKQDYSKFLDKLQDKLESLFINKINKDRIKDVFEKSDIDIKYIEEFDKLMEHLNEGMKNIIEWNDRGLELNKLNMQIPKHFNKLFNHKKDFSLKSLRFSFALRLALAVTTASFVSQWLELIQGKWMVYTVFVLIQPYYENCKTKAKERLQGTLIGALIVLVSFSLIENTGGRFAVIMFAGFLNPFFKNYRDMAITFTVSAVASAALMGGTTEYVVARIAFVIIGTGIALFANRFILPFKIEDGKRTLVDIYDYITRQMLRDIKNIESEHSVKSLFLIPSLIEDRMHLLNFGVDCEEENEFINNRRVLINDIYKQYMSLKRGNGDCDDIKRLIEEMEKSLNYQ